MTDDQIIPGLLFQTSVSFNVLKTGACAVRTQQTFLLHVLNFSSLSPKYLSNFPIYNPRTSQSYKVDHPPLGQPLPLTCNSKELHSDFLLLSSNGKSMDHPVHRPPTPPRGIVDNYSCCIFQGSFQFIIPQIPLTAERANPTLQPNIPAHQQGDDATVQNRSCPRCSEAQRTQVRLTTEYPVERQDPKPFGVSSLCADNTIPPLITSLFKDAKIPYMNQDQNVNNRSETATIVPDREWATQTAVRANDISHVLIAEVLA